MFDEEAKRFGGGLATFIEDAFELVIGKHQECLWQDYKFWLGLVIVFMVLAEGRYKLLKSRKLDGTDARTVLKFAEILGIDLIFLSFLQYVHHWLQCCYAFSFCYLLFWTFHSWSKKEKKSFSGSNVYMDVKNTAFSKVVLVFFGQLLLTKFLVNSTRLIVEAKLSYLYWFTAFIAVQNTAIFGRGDDSQVGSPFKGGTWSFLVANASRLRFRAGKDEDAFSIKIPNLWARFFMDFIVNGVVRDGIAYTTPLLLMASESDLEFVQNALAVLFIPTLDDKGDGVEYQVELAGNDEEAVLME